jgi:hypothetical protein
VFVDYEDEFQEVKLALRLGWAAISAPRRRSIASADFQLTGIVNGMVYPTEYLNETETGANMKDEV